MKRILTLLALIPALCFAGVTTTVPSGNTYSFASGSALTLNGTFGGTPTGGTLSLTGVTLTMPVNFITGLTEDTTPSLANDFTVTYDASANALKKVKLQNIGSSGDVVGPASATDNAIVRFNSTTGKLVQNSAATIEDTGQMSIVKDLRINGDGDFTGSIYFGNLLNTFTSRITATDATANRVIALPDADIYIPIISNRITITGPAAPRTYAWPDSDATFITDQNLMGITATGTVTSGTWSGSFGAVSGANLTSLNASNISSGTLVDARNTVSNGTTTTMSALGTVGTITSGTWSGSFGAVSGANLTTLNAGNISSGTLAAARGGTGVSNTGTITLGGNLVTTGAFNTTLAQSATTTVTLPGTSSTMARTDTGQTFTGSNTFAASSSGQVLLGQDPTASPYYANMLVKATATGQDVAVALESTRLSTTQRWFFGSGSGGGGTNNNFRVVDLTATNADRLNIVSGTGVVQLLAGVAASSSTTGTLVVTGGAGISGHLYIGSSLAVTGIITPTGGIVGKTDASNATAGNVGEYVSASVVQGSATALTTATPKTVTSITLSAGDWDIVANGSLTGASTGTAFDVAISTTTNSFTGTVLGDTRVQSPTVSLTGADASLMVPDVRVTISGSTTYYLVVQETFTIGTPAAYGRISARRRR